MLMNKNLNIQMLRGIACLMVFLSHLLGIIAGGPKLCGISLNETPLRLIWGGNAGVIIFFVLSGFFIKTEKFSIKNYAYTVYKRHKRIYPIFIVVLMLALLAMFYVPKYNTNEMSSWFSSFWGSKSSTLEYVKNFFLISNFDSHLIDPPIWTLRIEMRMIFVLPFTIWVFTKCPKNFWIVLYMAFFAVSLLVSPISYLSVFMIGVIAKGYVNEGYRLKVFQKIVIAVLGVILLDTEYILNWIDITVNNTVMNNLTAIGTVLIVVLLYDVKLPQNKALIWMGNYSFYFYLIHFIVMLWFRFLLSYVNIAVYGVITFLVSVALAYLAGIFDRLLQKWISIVENKIKGCA